MSRPAIITNRKHARVTELLHHVLNVVDRHLQPDAYRDCARELEDLFYSAGVDIITEAMRAEAGLPSRNHHGVTLQELKIIEAKMMLKMLEPIHVPGLPDAK